MHIAFISSTRRWGGIKTWSIDTGRVAVRCGHEVFVYGRDPKFIEAGTKNGMNGYLVRFGMDFSPRTIAFFYREFKKNEITHVVVNVGKDLRTAGIAARLCGIPVIVQVGAPLDFTNSSLRKFVHQFIQPSYVCCSEFIANNIVKQVPYLLNARVEAVYPGTPMPDDPPCPSRLPYTLITTSQLTPPKRHSDLIEGCALLKEQGVPFHLRIVGVGDQEENLRELVRNKGLEEYVTFRGFSTAIGEELRQADIFVLPTDAEPLGIALEEAMAHGLFPVARNSGGAPEIWPEQFRSSLLPPDAGPREFADGLRALLGTPPHTLDVWRQSVQAHARTTFSQEKQFALFAEFLKTSRS